MITVTVAVSNSKRAHLWLDNMYGCGQQFYTNDPNKRYDLEVNEDNQLTALSIAKMRNLEYGFCLNCFRYLRTNDNG